MTRAFTILMAVCLFSSVSAHAEDKTRYDLPGNVTLTTGTDPERNIIILRNDNVSPIVRAIVNTGHYHENVTPLQNTVPYSAFRQACGETRTVSERNHCVGRIISQKKRHERSQN